MLRYKTYYSLNHALSYKSKTKPYPFVIAHDCDEQYLDRSTQETRTRSRIFFAFDDVEQFLRARDDFPHSHEVVFNRFTDCQQGRLVFDFDFDKAWYGLKPRFVCDNFEKMMEDLVVETFQRYYDNVDTNKFVFVWLVSDVIDKWSKHLIVKNAFFADDWKKQTQIFYQLLLGIVEERKIFRGLKTEDLIDTQVARTNATMRMMGCSKLAKRKILKLERPEGVNFYDTLIQLYRREDVKREQHIYLDQVRKKYLDELFYEREIELIHNQFYKSACDLCDIDLTKPEYDYGSIELTENDVANAFEAFEMYFCQATNSKKQLSFNVKGVMGSLINLERRSPGKCILSGKIHDNENAYLTISPDRSVYFHCRRGCKFKGRKNICVRLTDQDEPDSFIITM